MTIDNCVCIKCGETKFPVYIGEDIILFRCLCEKTMDSILDGSGIMIKGVNKE